MINFSFSISPFLRSRLDEIDRNRVKTLTSLVSRDIELNVVFDAHVRHVQTLLHSFGGTYSESHVEQVLAKQTRTSIKRSDQEILSYFQVLQYIQNSWFMNAMPVDLSTIRRIAEILNESIGKSQMKELQIMLDFIQAKAEHPVIQAGLSRIIMYQILGENITAMKLSPIIAWLFLVKNGYDFRQLLVPEEAFKENFSALYNTMNNAISSKNLSSYLENHTNAIAMQAEKVPSQLKNKSVSNSNVDISISTRQQEILSLLSKPSSTITNRQVQSLFGVSQVTASRDLANLVALNLIFPVGKGRSARYKKA